MLQGGGATVNRALQRFSTRPAGCLVRLATSRLFEFAKILDVPVLYFFDEMAPGHSAKRRKVGWPKRNSGGDPDIKLKSETFEFVRAYYKIGSDDVRQTVRVMVQALAGKV